MSGIARVRLSAWAVGAVVLTVAVSGCSSSPSGPKAKESAAKMAVDARWVAAKVRAGFKPLTAFTVTQDGRKAVSCGHGKASYSFAGHQTFRIAPKSSYPDFTTVFGSSKLHDERGYDADDDATRHDEQYTSHDTPLVNKKATVHLTLSATASSETATTELWTVTARTDCLRTG